MHTATRILLGLYSRSKGEKRNKCAREGETEKRARRWKSKKPENWIIFEIFVTSPSTSVAIS